MRKHSTMIGCPACAGCLSVEEGPHDHKQFVCSVGHTFSLWEIYKSKEAELERAQWSTMALYKHLEMILGMLLKPPSVANAPEPSTIKHRLAQIAKQAAAVQQVIENTRLPARRTGNSVEDVGESTVR